MIFDGTWYCYYSVKLEPNQTALGESLISGDYCSKLYGSRRHVVKISDPREYAYLYLVFGPEAIHLGATLVSGTTYQWQVFIAINAEWKRKRWLNDMRCGSVFGILLQKLIRSGMVSHANLQLIVAEKTLNSLGPQRLL